MLWEPPTHIYSGPIRRGIGGQHLVPYGRKHGYYTRSTSLGQAGCFDSLGNSVDCSDPNCAQGNCVTPGLAPPPAAPAAGVPTGSTLQYEAQWETTAGGQGMNAQEIITAVGQKLPTYGMQLIQQQNDYSPVLGYVIKMAESFNVQLTVQVTGAGYDNPLHAGQNIDHAYYLVTNKMPVFSRTTLMSGPPGSLFPPQQQPTGGGGGTTPTQPMNLSCQMFGVNCPPPPGQQSMSAWIQQNATMLVMLVVAAIVLPPAIKKL